MLKGDMDDPTDYNNTTLMTFMAFGGLKCLPNLQLVVISHRILMDFGTLHPISSFKSPASGSTDCIFNGRSMEGQKLGGAGSLAAPVGAMDLKSKLYMFMKVRCQ